MQRYCVLTAGRSGSTALMNALAAHADIAVPCKDVASEDQELLHPRDFARYAAAYRQLTGLAVDDGDALIEAFYAHHAHDGYAGFKTMPERHAGFDAFCRRSDIRFIVLTRRDVASTVASFFVAAHTGSWRRDGEPQAARWTFGSDHLASVLGHLDYVLRSNAQLAQVPAAIRLSYEDLCQPDFSSPELNALFGRHIALKQAKPPTEARSYMSNWPVFEQFIAQQTLRLLAT